MSSAETYFLLIGIVIGALAAAAIVLVAYYLAGHAPPHTRPRARLLVVLGVLALAGCGSPTGLPVCTAPIVPIAWYPDGTPAAFVQYCPAGTVPPPCVASARTTCLRLSIPSEVS